MEKGPQLWQYLLISDLEFPKIRNHSKELFQAI